MKLKGINAFEQHVEKIVLGVAVLGVVGIAAWQFLSAPAFKVGRDTVPPADVDRLLDRKAQALQTQLRGDSNIKIPSDDVPLAGPAFTERMAKPVSPVRSYARSSPSFNGMLVKSGGAAADVWYHEPRFGPLTMLKVDQTADALTTESAKAAAEVSAIVKAEFGSIDAPKDVVWTTPVASISLKAIRDELKRAEPTAQPPRAQVPGVWYQETAFIVDVVFERQERKADGSWSEPVEVPIFSPRDEELLFRPRIAAASAELQEDVFNSLGTAQKQLAILQPDFYDTVNSAFVAPTLGAGDAAAAASGDGGAARKRMQQRTQLDQKQRSAEALRGDLTKLGGPWDEAQERKVEEERKREEAERKAASGGSGGGSSGGRSGGGGGLGGAMKKGDTETKGAAERERDAKRVRLVRIAKTKQLKKLDDEIAALEKQLGEAPSAGTKKSAPSLASMEEAVVWGHDLEVKPGGTYRYRCVARVYNPLFGKGNQLVKEQAGSAAAFVVSTEKSPWSSEVTVSPRVRFFVTRATVGDGALQGGTAQVEVYRFVEGRWRRSEVLVQPGDRIGRVDSRPTGKDIDFATQFFLVDIVEDLEAKGKSGSERRPGMAVVRSLDGDEMQVRAPLRDLDDAERRRLREQLDTTPGDGKSTDGKAADGKSQGGGKPGA
jgi:uncharacterized membrane protein YgcG